MTKTITAAQFRQIKKPAARSKYKNKKTEGDGITFHSKREADYYSELKLREAAGEVCEVQMQVPYKIVIDGQLICTYRADFVFYDMAAKKTRVIDVKGFVTPIFRLKSKLMEAVNGITIEVVK